MWSVCRGDAMVSNDCYFDFKSKRQEIIEYHPCTRIKPIKHTTKGSQRSNWQRINPPRSKHKNTNYNQPNNSSHRPGPHSVDTTALHHKWGDDGSALCGDGNPYHLRSQRSPIWDCLHNLFPPSSSLLHPLSFILSSPSSPLHPHPLSTFILSPPSSSLQTLSSFTLHASHRCALATMSIALKIPQPNEVSPDAHTER